MNLNDRKNQETFRTGVGADGLAAAPRFGDRVRCRDTGVVGIVTRPPDGCSPVRCAVNSPVIDDDGKMQWLRTSRLEVLELRKTVQRDFSLEGTIQIIR